MKTFLVFLLLLTAALPAGAAVFTVTKTADTLDGACDTDCSLREAVTAANARPGGDLVVLGPGVHALTRLGPFEDASATGDLDVEDELMILGAGAGETILDGGGTDRAGTLAAPLDPKLSPLGNHGGPMPTHALLPDSPAVDFAPAYACEGVDQRGRPRPTDGNRDGTPGCDAGAFELQPSCQPGGEALCLGADHRFRVTARWTAQGTSGTARAVPLTADTGAFWFFGPQNLELQIKVLDGCGVNQRFWVFLTGLTDVGVEVRVEDVATGESWLYGRPGGSPLPTITDTNAFATCS